MGKHTDGRLFQKDAFPRNKIRHVHGKLLVTTCKQLKLEKRSHSGENTRTSFLGIFVK